MKTLQIESENFIIKNIVNLKNGDAYQLEKEENNTHDSVISGYLLVLNYSPVANFMSNTFGASTTLKIGKNICCISDGKKLLAIKGNSTDIQFLPDESKLNKEEPNKIETRFGSNIDYIKNEYGLTGHEFIKIAKDELGKIKKLELK